MGKTQKVDDNYTPLSAITTKIGSGATPRGGKESYKTEGISLIRSLNVHDFIFKLNDLALIDDNQASRLKNVTVSDKDILLNITGASVCRCCMVPPSVLPARVNQHVAIVRLNSKLADPYYVLYTINSRSFKDGLLNISMTGATREALTKSDIENFKIPIPPLATQRKIAAILTAYDDLIEVNKRRIALLENMAEEIYREWFVRMRFPGHQDTRFVKGVPEGWEIRQIGDLCSTVTDGSHFSPPFVEGGKPMASVKDMHRYGFDLKSVKTISEADFETLKKGDCQPRLNDVLIAKDGSYLKHVFVWGGNYDIVILSSIAILRPNLSKIRPHFFARVLKQDSTKSMMSGYVSGSALPRIILKDFKKMKIMIPTADLMDKYEECAATVFSNIDLFLEANQTLTKTRDLLLPRLISGKLSVDDLNIQFPPNMQEAAKDSFEAT